MMTKRVLHVGCGAKAAGKLHPAFGSDEWLEVRLDIDAAVLPDIVATMTDMSPVAEASVDAVFSSHNLEHLYPHEVPVAMAEFRRVLKPGGFALITLPDLQEVARLVASDGLEATAYLSALGPIQPLDILFGHRGALAGGNLFMAHHTGFTSATLIGALAAAGFASSTVQRVPSSYSLWAIAFCMRPSPLELETAQNRMLPLHLAYLATSLEETRSLELEPA